MKKTAYILFFFITCTAVIWGLDAIGITPVTGTPGDLDNWDTAYNASAVVDTSDPTTQDFYQVGTGLYMFWKTNVPIIEDVIAFVEVISGSEILANIFRIIWRPIWFGWVIAFITGRDFMP